MNGNSTIKGDLRAYIMSAFLPGESQENVTDDTPLRTSGVIDSMGLLRLVGYVESQYGIELKAHETSVENFDTIEAIADLIETKIASEA